MTSETRPTAAARASATLALLAVLTPATTPEAGAAGRPTAALVSATDQLRVLSDGGEPFTLDLEAGVRIDRAESLADGWIAAGVRDDRTLLLIRAHTVSGGADRVPTPSPGGPLVAEPVPLVEGGDLVGLAWLAGDGAHTFGVRYAAWLGDRWGPTETVSPPGPGSQLALTGVALDGDVLLLWSAFDGSDDEILWSRRADGRSGEPWTEPARIADDNGVPDITPAVAVLDGRPVAAWSRYDGRDYRLVLSGMDAGSWGPPRVYGPPGSLFPRFEPAAESALLRFRDARAEAWTLLRLGPDLRPTARASVESPGDAEPVVLGFDEVRVEVIVEPRRPAVEIPWERR